MRYGNERGRGRCVDLTTGPSRSTQRGALAAGSDDGLSPVRSARNRPVPARSGGGNASRRYTVVIAKAGRTVVFQGRDLSRILKRVRNTFGLRSGHQHSDETDKFIRSNYRAMPADKIAECLSVDTKVRFTKNMVISRAGRLGLRKPRSS